MPEPIEHAEGDSAAIGPSVLGGGAERWRRLEITLIVVAVGLGAILRFTQSSPMWLDEALSVNIASLPVGDIPEALRHDGHPPLYYFLLHYWMSLFGDSDFAIRSLSGVFSLLLLPVGWAIGNEIGGRRAGWTVVAVISMSPFAIRYGAEARMYSEVMLLVGLGMLLVRKSLQSRSRIPALLVAPVMAALLLSHYWAIWLLAAGMAILAVVAFLNRESRPTYLSLMFGGAVGALPFLIWLPSFLHQVEHTGTPWAAPSRPTVVAATTIADLGGGLIRDSELLGIMIVLFSLLSLTAVPLRDGRLVIDLRTVARVRPEGAVVLLTLALGTAAGIIAGTAYQSRYVSVVVPAILTMVGLGVYLLPRSGHRVLALLALTVGGAGISIATADRPRSQAGQHQEILANAAEPGDVVVVCPDQLGPSAERAVDGRLEVLAYPTLDEARFVDWEDYAKRNASVDPHHVAMELIEVTSRSSSVFVVWSPGYRTLEGQCEGFLAALAQRRPRHETLARADTKAYESSNLTRYFPEGS